jgi:hypothetical protein
MVPFRLVQQKISTHRRKKFYTRLEHERGAEPLTILPLDLEQRQEKKIKHEEKSDLVACTLESMEPFSWSMQSHTRKGISDLIVCY